MAQNGLFPVTYARHGHRYWKRFTSYEFAANQTVCPVVLHEIQQVAAAFPIVFMKTEAGVEPRALLSLSADLPTPFVSHDGRWLACYVPSSLRRYPFQAERAAQKQSDDTRQYRLLVDESSGFVTRDPKDEAFFQEDGTPSQELQDVQAFFQSYMAANEVTLNLCKTLDELRVFEPLDAQGAIEILPDALEIDLSRVAGLSQAEKLVLLETGAFWLIHAHTISLSHCEWISRAQQQLAHRASLQKYTENSDSSGFLDAMANAQNDVFLESSGV